MTIVINRAGETGFGNYSKGDIVLNLPTHQENLLLESGVAQRLDDENDNLVMLASGVLIAAADVAAAGLPAGVLLKDPTTGLLYGQSDGAGGYVELGEGSGGGYLGSGNQAAMLAVAGAGVVVGAWFLRTDLIPATNYYLDALPADTLGNWRPGLPVDQNPPVASAVCLGGIVAEGYTNIGFGGTWDRTGNILTITASLPAGGNYVGQKVDIYGVTPHELNGTYTKFKVTAGSFSVYSPGPDLADGAILGANFRSFRPSHVRHMHRGSPFSQAIMESNRRMRNLGNLSTLNETWASVGRRLHRDAAIRQATRVVCMLGLYDLSTRLAGAAATDAQGVMDQATPVLLALIAMGVHIDLCSIEPVPVGHASQAAYNTRIPLVNTLYAAFASQYPDQVHYIDTWSVLAADAGGGTFVLDAAYGQGGAGAELRASGARAAGKRLADTWAALGAYGRRYLPEPARQSGNLALGFLTNTGGGTGGTGYGSGAVPVGWTVERTTGAATFNTSIVLRADGTYDLQIDTLQATAAASKLRARYTGLHTYMPPGSKWRVAFDWAQVGAAEAAGNMGPMACTAETTVDNGQGLAVLYLGWDSVALPTTGSKWADNSGTFVSEEFQIPFGGNHTAFALNLEWATSGQGGAGGTIAGAQKFANVTLIKTGDQPTFILKGSATWDIPSVATLAYTAATTVTVAGAAVGDLCNATFSLGLGGLILYPWVSAEDTVSVIAYNPTGGTVDIASGTLSVRVAKNIGAP